MGITYLFCKFLLKYFNRININLHEIAPIPPFETDLKRGGHLRKIFFPKFFPIFPLPSVCKDFLLFAPYFYSPLL